MLYAGMDLSRKRLDFHLLHGEARRATSVHHRNDAKVMAKLYKDLLGFKSSAIVILTDADATKTATHR